MQSISFKSFFSAIIIVAISLPGAKAFSAEQWFEGELRTVGLGQVYSAEVFYVEFENTGVRNVLENCRDRRVYFFPNRHQLGAIQLDKAFVLALTAYQMGYRFRVYADDSSMGTWCFAQPERGVAEGQGGSAAVDLGLWQES